MAKAPSSAASALDRLKELDEERNQLLEGAQSEAMERASEAISELNALGFSYRLTECGGGGGRGSSGSTGRKGASQVNARVGRDGAPARQNLGQRH